MAATGEWIREIVTLSTPRGRLTAWPVLSILIFIVPYDWLSDLSLWQRLGWDSAPSIGLTRAYWLLLHGQLSAALQRNFLILPIVVIGSILLFVDVIRTVQGRQRYTKDLN